MIYKNGWTVNKFQQRYLFLTCNLTAITSLFATYMKVKPIQYVPIYSIWVTSILYWWNPTQGWRRTLDVIISHTCIGFFTTCLLYYRPKNWLPCAAGIAASSYFFRTWSLDHFEKLKQIHNYDCPLESEGIYTCPIKSNHSWKSVLHHSGIHIFTNLAAGVAIYFYGSEM
jgi:hypothetical protein